MMDIQDILKVLPHRPPFLLVDKVLECIPNKSIRAVKNISINEPYFVGHFPGYPIMPGVLMIEALAQVAGILAIQSNEQLKSGDYLYYLAGVDNARFKRIVKPGDQLELSVEVLRIRQNILKFNGIASVDGELACSAEITTAYKEQVSLIDSRAEVHPKAKLGKDVTIGPWAFIGPDVEIGAGTTIGAHAVIDGVTRIGKNNQIFQFASIGEKPQDLKYQGEATLLEIGDNNTFREFSTINTGTVQGGGITKIGNHNLFMNYVHIAHDCRIGDYNVFSNNASLAGHVVVYDRVIFGSFAGVHQFCQIGSYSFLSAGSLLTLDVPPYILVSRVEKGTGASAAGLNLVGLKRNGFSPEAIRNLQKAYKILYQKNLRLEEAIETLKEIVPECPEVQLLVDFLLHGSGRGIVR